MSLKALYKGYSHEDAAGVMVTTETYYGTQAECEAYLTSHPHDTKDGTKGILKSVRVSQAEGPQWQVEARWEKVPGKYIASMSYETPYPSMSLSMMALPICKAENYKTCWDHYLFAAKTSWSQPSFWEDATDEIIPDDFQKQFLWGKDARDLPEGWVVALMPTKPGVETIDKTLVTVTISKLFKTAAKAGQYARNKANTIGTPEETFGESATNWKCDGGTVTPVAKGYLATLTWTEAGDPEGWDTDMYD